MSGALSPRHDLRLVSDADEPAVAAAPETALSDLKRWFLDAEDATGAARRDAERDRDYYDGIQWTADEVAALERRKQPVVTINYVQRKVDLLKGYERRMRTDPKAIARTPNEDEGADAATAVLRYVADDQQFPVTVSEVFENMMIEGFGGAEVSVEPGEDGYEIRITHYPWDRLFYDPHSRRADFADARYLGSMVWMDTDEARDMFPDADEAITTTLDSESSSDTFGDRPRDGIWCDNRRTRIRVVQAWYRQGGEWMTATYTGGGFLSPPQVSPYVDQRGRSACALVLQSAYVNRKNERYGLVRSMISPQDEINKRRSKLMHNLSTRQVIMEEGAVSDVDEARREVARPDGIVVVNPGLRFEVSQNTDLSVGQMQLLQHATSEMQASGPNASMAGKDPRALSGRAIQAQQQGGSVELEPLMDSLRQFKRRVFEAVWMRARQYWTGEKWLRVTDDARNAQWVGLNRPVTLADHLDGLPPEEAQATAAQIMPPLQPGDPRLQMVVRTENDVSSIAVNITVEEGPDVASLQAETFDAMAQLAGAGAIQLPAEAWVEMNPAIRDKDKILRILEEAAQRQAQAQQQAAQIAMAEKSAEIENTQADTVKKQADAMKAVAGINATVPQPAQRPGQGAMPAGMQPGLTGL